MGLGFGIRKKPIPDPRSRIQDPGVKKAPDPGSGSALLQVSMRLASKPFFSIVSSKYRNNEDPKRGYNCDGLLKLMLCSSRN
jgi:hypothetical protein